MNKVATLLRGRLRLRKSAVDMAAGAVVMAVSLFLLLVGIPHFIEEGYGNTYGLSPKTFPIGISCAALVLGVILFYQGWQRHKSRDEEEYIEFYLISAAVLADILFFVLTIKSLGYPLANMVMMFVMYYLSGGSKWQKAVVMSVAFTACSVLFFYYYLKLSVPMGVLSFLIH